MEDNIEYKGIFYNDNQEKQYYEGGAHFRYIDLYNILDQIQRKEKKKQKKILLDSTNNILDSNHFNKKLKIIMLHKVNSNRLIERKNNQVKISRNKKPLTDNNINNSCQSVHCNGGIYSSMNNKSLNDKIKYQYGSIFTSQQGNQRKDKLVLNRASSLLCVFPALKEKNVNTTQKIKVNQKGIMPIKRNQSRNSSSVIRSLSLYNKPGQNVSSIYYSCHNKLYK